jgi:hypothetical protein
MSTERQIDANRRNSQLSTGPRTAEGKSRVGRNALKHGLTARLVVLPHENPREFNAFRRDLLRYLGPQSAFEELLAENIVIDLWRLRRVPVLEATLYSRGAEQESPLELMRRLAREAEDYIEEQKALGNHEFSKCSNRVYQL